MVTLVVIGGTAISANARPHGVQAAPTRVNDALTYAATAGDDPASTAAKDQHTAQVAYAKLQADALRLNATKAVAQQHRWVLPMKSYSYVSAFGERWGRLHAGIDLATPIGTPVVSMSTGVVKFVGQKQGYGDTLVIQYWDGTQSLYGHLNQTLVKEGQQVAPGQLVAKSGNTGHSYGPHLHLEIRPQKSTAESIAKASNPTAGIRSSLAGAAKASGIVALAAQDSMARAGEFYAPVDPIAWLKAHRLTVKGAK